MPVPIDFFGPCPDFGRAREGGFREGPRFPYRSGGLNFPGFDLRASNPDRWRSPDPDGSVLFCPPASLRSRA